MDGWMDGWMGGGSRLTRANSFESPPPCALAMFSASLACKSTELLSCDVGKGRGLQVSAGRDDGAELGCGRFGLPETAETNGASRAGPRAEDRDAVSVSTMQRWLDEGKPHAASYAGCLRWCRASGLRAAGCGLRAAGCGRLVPVPIRANRSRGCFFVGMMASVRPEVEVDAAAFRGNSGLRQWLVEEIGRNSCR